MCFDDNFDHSHVNAVTFALKELSKNPQVFHKNLVFCWKSLLNVPATGLSSLFSQNSHTFLKNCYLIVVHFKIWLKHPVWLLWCKACPPFSKKKPNFPNGKKAAKIGQKHGHNFVIFSQAWYHTHVLGIFHRRAQAVKRMMARHGYKAIVVYLDDFLVIGVTSAECCEIFNCLLELLQNLGFSINWKKVVPPTQCLIFLGALIDTIHQSMSLPHDKLVALQELLLSFQHRCRASKRLLQRLAGKLNWACRVIYGGRTFFKAHSGFYELSASARCLLDCGFYEDLNWCVQFLAVFNGRQLFLDSTAMVDGQTDACFDAAGAYFSWLF